jgi:uncharacterized OsmC-like protein
MATDDFTVTLDWRDDYQFTARFDQPGMPDLATDEPAPLGAGAGPNPARLLATAVANCLAASLLHCLRKSRIDLVRLRATARGSLVRNAAGRLRIGAIQVQLAPALARPEDHDRMARCLDLFEDFCIVTESVRSGLAVAVEVVDAAPATDREPATR